MKAMILAAGRGERLRPLTDNTPKPLIKAGNKSLIEYHLENLASAGFQDIVINTAWLADTLHQQLGDGSRYGLTIQYSDEGEALETAGGIINALPLLGEDAFLVVNGDIWTDFDFASFNQKDALSNGQLAHLILVNNPEHHPQGDFVIENGLLSNHGMEKHTYSGMAIFSPAFFKPADKGKLPLAPLLRKYADAGRISAQHFGGRWTDVGTLDRLQSLDDSLQNNKR